MPVETDASSDVECPERHVQVHRSGIVPLERAVPTRTRVPTLSADYYSIRATLLCSPITITNRTVITIVKVLIFIHVCLDNLD